MQARFRQIKFIARGCIVVYSSFCHESDKYDVPVYQVLLAEKLAQECCIYNF